MRPPPAVPRLLLSSALAALALAGCSRDLALPGAPTSPTLAGFTPAAAYAGQLVWISGAHFDADPAANSVNFAAASARGLRFDGADLVVRVPADAGDGTLTVANRQGTSAASASAFDYLGLGEPRLLQLASSAAILQQPRAVYAFPSGDVVMDSALHQGLVWAGNSGNAAEGVFRSAAHLSPTSALYVTRESAAGPPAVTPLLKRIDERTTATVQVTLPSDADQILDVPSLGVVLTFHQGALSEEVAAWNGTSLSHVALSGSTAPVPIGVEIFSGAADVGDGRIVVAAFDGLTLSPQLVLVDLAAMKAGTPKAPVPISLPLSFPTGLGFPQAANLLTPLAVGHARLSTDGPSIATGPHVAAVAFDDGTVGLADLDAATPAFVQVPVTFGAAPVESLAAGTSGTVIATRPADGLAVEIDLATGVPLWSVAGAQPTVASALGDLAFVGDAGDNRVLVANLVTGATVGVVDFDVAPGLADGTTYVGAAAYLPNASGPDGSVLFPSSAFPGLLRYSTSNAETFAVGRTAGITAVASDFPTRSIWAAAGGTTPAVKGYPGGAWSFPVSVALPALATPQRMAAQGTRVALGTDAGIVAFDGATPPATASVAPIPGAPPPPPGVPPYPAFTSIGFTPSGGVWTLVDAGTGAEVQLWPAPPIAATAAPVATWTVPAGVSNPWAVWLEDGLWVFAWDGATARETATLLDATLKPIRTVRASAGLLAGAHAVSPNGRMLVVRETDLSVGFLVRFFSADPAGGFPAIGGLVLDSRVSGFAFDATGERLYVLTQAPDRIVSVD